MQSSTPEDGATVGAATEIVVVASEPVAALQGATLDGNPATGEISGAVVKFSSGPLDQGEHTLSGTLVDAAGNTGNFAVHFTVRVNAHATLILKVGKPSMKAKAKNRAFVIPLTLSVPASVSATLFSPKNKKLRTLQTDLTAGQHSLQFVVPTASLPPGRYTILVVATGADGSRIVKRVRVTIKKAKAKRKRPAPKHKAKQLQTNAVVIPVAPAPPPRGGGSAPAPAPPRTKAHVARPKVSRPMLLETATSYVHRATSLRNVGLGLVLLSLGLAFAFLVKIELGRMLGSPRRLA
jgi:methionine-rich copper-binding protein CopC